jgi:hypothetical protein
MTREGVERGDAARIVVLGGARTVQVWLAGVGSMFGGTDVSRARTRNRWSPRVRPEARRPDVFRKERREQFIALAF